jgi:hypothetical protein
VGVQDVPKQSRPPGAVRLTFSFGPEGVRLLDRQAIDKRLPPADDLPAELDATSVAAEVRSAAGAPSYRVVVPQAIPRDVEVFDPDGTSHRDPTPPARGVFTVLVPADPDAVEVVLLTGEREPTQKSAQAGGRPVEYGRFSLRPDDTVGHS